MEAHSQSEKCFYDLLRSCCKDPDLVTKDDRRLLVHLFYEHSKELHDAQDCQHATVEPGDDCFLRAFFDAAELPPSGVDMSVSRSQHRYEGEPITKSRSSTTSSVVDGRVAPAPPRRADDAPPPMTRRARHSRATTAMTAANDNENPPLGHDVFYSHADFDDEVLARVLSFADHLVNGFFMPRTVASLLTRLHGGLYG